MHTASAYIRVLSDSLRPPLPLRRGTSEYISIRQHTLAYAYVSICIRPLPIYASCLTLCGLHYLFEFPLLFQASSFEGGLCRYRLLRVACQHTSAYVSIRQHTSAYVSIRQHTSAYVSIRAASVAIDSFLSPAIRKQQQTYVSIRQHTSAYFSIRHLE
jgi:hypothetical protein